MMDYLRCEDIIYFSNYKILINKKLFKFLFFLMSKTAISLFTLYEAVYILLNR